MRTLGSSRRVSSPEVMEALTTGKFENLLGMREGLELEFKRKIDLKRDQDKHDLAKAVSALANTSGGVLIIGVDRGRDPANKCDYASGLTYVPDVELARYYQLLTSWLYPYPGLAIDSFGEPPHCLVGIRVDKAADQYPILVTHSITEGLCGGSVFGFYRRSEQESFPLKYAELHSLIRTGERLGNIEDIRERLDLIESQLQLMNRSCEHDKESRE